MKAALVTLGLILSTSALGCREGEKESAPAAPPAKEATSVSRGGTTPGIACGTYSVSSCSDGSMVPMWASGACELFITTETGVCYPDGSSAQTGSQTEISYHPAQGYGPYCQIGSLPQTPEVVNACAISYSNGPIATDTDCCIGRCVPTTCALIGVTEPPGSCGPYPDGCGGTLDCGCSPELVCNNGQCEKPPECYVSNSPTPFAPPASSKKVRLIYLVPADRTERADYMAAMARAAENIQLFLSEQMIDPETFTLPDPIIESYVTPHNADWYGTNAVWGNFAERYINNIEEDGHALTGGSRNDPDNIWIFYIDADPLCGQNGGAWVGEGVAMLGANDLRGLVGGTNVPACANARPDKGGVCRWVGGLGHELVHAIGRHHPDGCVVGLPGGGPSCDSGALMWEGVYNYPNTYLTSDDQAALASNCESNCASYRDFLE